MGCCRQLMLVESQTKEEQINNNKKIIRNWLPQHAKPHGILSQAKYSLNNKFMILTASKSFQHGSQARSCFKISGFEMLNHITAVCKESKPDCLIPCLCSQSERCKSSLRVSWQRSNLCGCEGGEQWVGSAADGGELSLSPRVTALEVPALPNSAKPSQ